ncbi:unnamed protein product [Paramecium pentaurelia]|uniref:UDENN domain-containing protein n=1 Tax=Paramecium pentaurelia TaxID=43138 RepID=A0A8S1SZA5_9CILI|nr:unnamed protein product [Paramecium pentaurelia]
MKKWLQKKLNQRLSDDQNKHRLTRKERYMRQYLNSEKCYNYWEIMTSNNLIQVNLNRESQGFVKQIQEIFKSPEQIFDVELQQKLMELYTLQEDQTPVLAIFAVGFHHKRGSEIEYCYPELSQLTNDIENIINIVTTCALPDAVHNANEDYLYFNFDAQIKEQKKQLFGVTCFKQIKVTEELKKQNPELTRGHIQKAICLLSFVPLFGYIKSRLEPTIQAYFQLQDFKDMSILNYAFDSILQTFDLKNVEISALYTDTNLIGLFWIFKDKIFKILKAVQYQMKIIIYSQSSSVCSRFIISLLSLIPGLLNFNLQSKKSLIQASFLSNFGLPFKIFTETYRLFMHFSVTDINMLQSSNLKGYLIGTTSKFIKGLNQLNPEIIIDIDTGELNILKEQHKKLLNLKLIEKQLYSAINTDCLKTLDQNQQDQLKKLIPIQNYKITFQGSEDWIRKIIHDHYIKMLSEISYFVINLQTFDERINKLTAIRTRKSMIIKQEISPQDSSDDDDNESQDPQKLEIKKHKEDLVEELKIKEYRNLLYDLMRVIRKHNRKGIIYWITKTENGLNWLKSFDYSIITNSECFDKNSTVSFYKVFDNADIYIGNMQYGGLIQLFQKRVYLGQIQDFLKHGQGRYEKLIDKKFQYKGQFKNNKFHGDGILIVVNEFQYNGHFENNQFNGYGNLQKENQIYEGWFKNGFYFGTGKLILPNKDVYVGQFSDGLFQGEGQYVWANGDIYKGIYKAGKRHGMGIYQTKQYTYEGEWVDDLKDGFGVITLQENNCKYQGQFQKDEIVINQEIIIKFPDDSIYKGQIKNYQPHGKGYLQFIDGKIQDGNFKEGNFIDQEEVKDKNEQIKSNQENTNQEQKDQTDSQNQSEQNLNQTINQNEQQQQQQQIDDSSNKLI